MKRWVLIFVVGAIAACAKEVEDPYYLDKFGEDARWSLIHCYNDVCARNGLPGPGVVAAGANARFIVVRWEGGGDGVSGLYYFRRMSKNQTGYENYPERIVGPLDERTFSAAKAKLGLPDFTVTP